jgi:rhodanese-related sulfurtransferase
MSSKPTLVGLIGRKGSGKDTAAVTLTAHGHRNVKFAGALKSMIRALLAYQGLDEETVERMVEGDLKEVPTPYLAGRTPRFAMQRLGDEWGRQLMDENFWVEVTKPLLREGNVVVTDVRYPNEVAAVEEAGGVPIGVQAEWIKATPGEHESEALIDGLIASLPANQKLINRSAKPGEDVALVIQEFQARFLHLLSSH